MGDNLIALRPEWPYFACMNKPRAIRLITKHAEAIRSFGVQHLYLFGSTARGDSNSASDVDIFVDLRRGAHFSLFDLIDLRRYLGRILQARADVFPRRGLHRVIRGNIEREAVRVF
jgi:predicted nucleotidyltransferase